MMGNNLLIKRVKFLIRKLQLWYYIKRLYFPFDENWFKGKRVAIIGGADSVLKDKLGDYIDDFDVVVRINKGVELIETQSDFVGKRTDVLFHSFLDNPKDIGHSPITIGLWEKHNVKKVVYSLNHKKIIRGIYDLIAFSKKSRNKMKFSEVPVYIYDKNLENIAPFITPTTGHVAVSTVFQCQPKELYVTGITFFKTPHNKLYRKTSMDVFHQQFTGKVNHHNPDAEYNYFKKIYENNKDIIKPDQTLKKILETN